MSRTFLTGAALLTPQGPVSGLGVLIDDGRIKALTDAAPSDARVETLDGGTLCPGFVDTQVNGGGGVLFNDEPTVEGVAAIAAAHARFGTTGLLPTLITDDLDVVARAIAAVDRAIEAGVPGVIGIHLEGPFLNPARKGVHDAGKMGVALDAAAIELLTSLKRGPTLVTLAPERAPAGAVRALTRRGAIVVGGHTDATWEETQAAFAEGLRGFTHLFNAMSPLTSRAPGVVGAAMDHAGAVAGIIVDGVHAHPASLRVALKAMGADRLMLVTDAMPTVGSASPVFTLDGVTIEAHGETCRTPDGVLAGSNLTMIGAVRNAVSMLGVDFATAVRMASAVPARVLGQGAARGALVAGLAADLVHVSDDLQVFGTWIAGSRIF